jgi:phenylalanyl-tRNA synthetase beta chain
LEQANYDAKLAGKRIEVNYPAYRQDIMHQRDIVEDVAISYGYNRIEPVAPRLKTAGGMDGHEVFSDRVAGVMAGLGFQEILSYTLTNKENLFRKMNVKETEVVEIENPVSTNWCVFRNCLLPSLMDFFSNNQHVDYPQRVFEVGDAVLVDSKEESRTRNARRLAAAISDSRVVYGGIASVLDAFLRKLNVKYELKKLKKSRRSSLSFIQSSFIDGRVADILVKNKIVGFVGEIHPAVLGKWKLEMPVAAFEIDVERLWKLMKK